MPDWSLVLVGLVVLMVSAEVLVRGAAWIATAAGIRPMVVGLTIVAFGTSAPELAASLVGALEGRPGLATGTVLGSNVANLALILGATACLAPIRWPSRSGSLEVRALLVATLTLPLPLWLFGAVPSWWGVGLLFAIVLFTVKLMTRERKTATPPDDRGAPPTRGEFAAHLLLLVLGLLGLSYGADLLVVGATGVAAEFGVSDQTIASVVIAVGTSLPELAASGAAALRRQPEIAVGNVIGSNLFNICMVLGGTAAITPLPFSWDGEGYHLVVCLGLTLAVVALGRLTGCINRWHGILLLAGYAAYLTGSALVG